MQMDIEKHESLRKKKESRSAIQTRNADLAVRDGSFTLPIRYSQLCITV
jgi:hypothetical protein